MRSSTSKLSLSLVVASISVLGAEHVQAVTLQADRSNDMSTFAAGYTWTGVTGTYAGITSTITGEVNVPTPPATPGSSTVYTTATLLAGTPSSPADVTMSWRTATTAESTGTSTLPPMTISAPYDGMGSDVLRLHGLSRPEGAQTRANGDEQVDPFVLQMTYDEDRLLDVWHSWPPTAHSTEAEIAELGLIRLGYLNVSNDGNIGWSYSNVATWDSWVVATDGNFNTGVAAYENFHGSFADFLTGPGAGYSLADLVGSWGVDTTNFARPFAGGYYGGVAWAVLDHNSDFAVIPEPTSIAVLALAGVGLLGRKQRA